MAAERAEADLTIGQLAERTGVSQPTIRMWEQRHSFPAPRRTESGHRRYSEADVELVRQVVREREAGTSMSAAVQRVVAARERRADSIYAGVRRRSPGLEPRPLDKRSMIGMAHAIEDECLARGGRPLLIGSFQEERFYRQAEERWRTLSARARLAVVFADFPSRREARGGPIELPIDRSDPLAREWTIVCRGSELSVALAGWERPANGGERHRTFESLWSVRGDLVDEAARSAAELAGRSAPDVGQRIVESVEATPAQSDGIDLLVSLTNRMLAYVARPPRTPSF